jgi:hypothetical protein
MKKTMILGGLLAAFVVLAGCRRNYQVVHARPAEDTIAHDDVQKVAEEDVFDEPLVDIPEAPKESDFTNVENSVRKEYDDYIKGQGQ